MIDLLNIACKEQVMGYFNFLKLSNYIYLIKNPMVDPGRNKSEYFLCLLSFFSVNIKDWQGTIIYSKNSSEKLCFIF